MNKKQMDLRIQIGVINEEAITMAEEILYCSNKNDVEFLAKLIKDMSDSNRVIKSLDGIYSDLINFSNYKTQKEKISAANCAVALKNFS